MDKIYRDQLELNSFTNDLFKEFSQSVEENDQSKHFLKSCKLFFRLENDNRTGCLKVR